MAKMFLWAILIFAAHSAMALTSEDCAQDCSIDKWSEGRFKVVCSCSKKKFSRKYTLFHLAKHKPLAAEKEIATRFPQASARERSIIANNSCASYSPFSGSISTVELKELHKLANLPLCLCAKAKAYFPLQHECHFTPSGEMACDLSLVNPQESKSYVNPIREITAFDYASCLQSRASYKKPESCETEAKCSSEPKVCAPGTTLFNVADKEACCPVYQCLSIHPSNSRYLTAEKDWQ